MKRESLVRTVALLALVAPALCCGVKPCEPSLCVESADGVTKLCAADAAPSAAAGASSALVEGQTVNINYALPPGIMLNDSVELRIETPCACGVATRTPSDPQGGQVKADSATCGAGAGIDLAVPLPKGGACRLTVTATAENESQTVTLSGSVAACALSCTPDIACAGTL